ncbi:transcriptional regulator, partial [Archaeoglobales archaeon ex4484_92]
ALGGQAFQSDVARLVDQPTTTLWRNIRRLAEKGYVRVEKRFGRNYLILLKA